MVMTRFIIGNRLMDAFEDAVRLTAIGGGNIVIHKKQTLDQFGNERRIRALGQDPSHVLRADRPGGSITLCSASLRTLENDGHMKLMRRRAGGRAGWPWPSGRRRRIRCSWRRSLCRL